MSNETIKFCPFLPFTEQRKGLTLGSSDFTVSYFAECLKEKCMAYVEGKCTRIENQKNK